MSLPVISAVLRLFICGAKPRSLCVLSYSLDILLTPPHLRVQRDYSCLCTLDRLPGAVASTPVESRSCPSSNPPHFLTSTASIRFLSALVWTLVCEPDMSRQKWF